MGELPLDTYAGLFVAGPRPAAWTTPPCTTRSASWPPSPCPTGATSTTPPIKRSGCERTGSKTTSIIATLGCPYGCDFCSKPVFGSAVRRRDLDAVFAEVEQIRGLGYDSLWIADDTFTLSQPYLEEFCRRIAGSGHDLELPLPRQRDRRRRRRAA